MRVGAGRRDGSDLLEERKKDLLAWGMKGLYQKYENERIWYCGSGVLRNCGAQNVKSEAIPLVAFSGNGL